MDAVVLRTRLDSFIKARYGQSGLARPQVPLHLWRWHQTVNTPDLAGFVWNLYDDVVLPAAVGIRMHSQGATEVEYDVAEWYGPKLIQLSRWQFHSDQGWTECR